MRNRQSFRRGLCTLMVALGCSADGGGGDDSTVKVGFLYSTHGFFGAYEPSYVDAAHLAVALINEQGGTLGRSLVLLPRSLPSDPSRTAQLAEDLVAAGVTAVIGPLVPPLIEQLGSIPRQRAVPFFILTGDLVFDEDPYLMGMLASPAANARFLAERALQADTRTMVVFYDASMARVEQTLRAHFEGRGGIIFSQLIAESDDLLEALRIGLGKGPSVVVLLTQVGLTGRLLNVYLRSYGAGEQPFFRLWPTACTSDFSAGVPGIGRLSHEIGTSVFRGSGVATEAFNAAYRARYPANVEVGHPAFDAVFATALAVAAAGSNDRARVHKALTEVTTGGTRYDYLAYGAALAAIARGEDVDYDGVSSRFDLGPDGQLATPEFTLCHFDVNGKQVLSQETYTLSP